jgi:Thioredoxin-like
MVQGRWGRKLLAGCLLLWGGASAAWAAPTVADVLKFKPRQEGVVITTPTAQEAATCTVDLDKGKVPGKGSGWVLKDANGKLLRRFFDSNGDGKIDVWSYYRDGVEVYREIDTDLNGKPDTYRWLNGGGSKIGLDPNEDGKIDAWRAISPEEVSQEVLTALVTKDVTRLQALLITDAEIKELPASEATRVTETRKNVTTKFQETVAKLTALGDKTRWLHLELSAPECLPADQTGGAKDLIRYDNGTILCETAGKNDWIQTGELIQVAGAWRLVDGPKEGLPLDPKGGLGEGLEEAVKPLLEQLNKIDEKLKQLPPGDMFQPNPEVVKLNLERADVLEKIVAASKPERRDPWIRQVADCLSTAVQGTPGGDKTAYERLQRLEDQLAKSMAGSNLAAYVTFREMTADYAARLSIKDPPPDFAKVQEYWLDRLAKFVTAYPKGEDTPDALLQLGMVSEFMNKETEAKKWYQKIATDFADKPQAAKAKGAVERLELEGKVIELVGPKLVDGQTFDAASLRGKLVVVYYWASWNQQTLGDFAKLKLLLDGQKGAVELVAVNLDATPDEAKNYLTRSPAPGVQLYQAGGLDSPLATRYGIMGLPNLFLIGKDGKVLSRTIQINGLEDEIKKQLAK